MASTLILGLGNPLQGDDGVGIRLIETLEQVELPADVELMDGGTPGVGLIHLMEGCTTVIIVDAAEMGRRPGEFVRFRPSVAHHGAEPDAILRHNAMPFSLHRPGVADALALADALGLRLPEVIIYGVQPARMGWSQELSPEVAAAIPRLRDAILKEWCSEGVGSGE